MASIDDRIEKLYIKLKTEFETRMMNPVYASRRPKNNFMDTYFTMLAPTIVNSFVFHNVNDDESSDSSVQKILDEIMLVGGMMDVIDKAASFKAVATTKNTRN